MKQNILKLRLLWSLNMSDWLKINISLISILLSSCSIGPDFFKPNINTSENFVRDETHIAISTPEPKEDDEFWSSFKDPILSKLIKQALSANNNLHLALSRYERENALLRESKFSNFPTITLDAMAGHQRLSQDQALGTKRSTDVFSLNANASWEIDFFGRIRRSIEAQRSETLARANDLKALQVSIVGEVANTYMHLRGTQQRLKIARENAENQKMTLAIVKSRLEAGRDTEFDLARASGQYETTIARIPEFEVQIATDQHRLAVLIGLTPESLISELEVQSILPSLPNQINPGTPSSLLRRRPDIAAAEERLHASIARIGIATSDLYPRLSLGAMFGSYAFSSTDIFKSRSESSFLILGIDWSFLDIGRVRARIAASNADASGLLAMYQQTVLIALEDTENALVSYSRSRIEIVHLEKAASEAKSASKLASIQHQAGIIGLNEVLDADRFQLEAQDSLVNGHTRSAMNAVRLYKSLAGGWSQSLPK
jgi:outer membrane protein, multidrug efflux system